MTASRRPRTCSVTGCGRRHYGHGYCRTHHARWRRQGDPGATVPIEPKTTGGVGYWSACQRVKIERGPASAQRCACGRPALSWSYDGTDPDGRTDPTRGYRYSLDPARYMPRCRPCHRRVTLDRATPRPRSASVVDGERAAWLYRAGASAPGIAALLGTSRTAVYTALRAHGVDIRPRGTRGNLAGPIADHTPSPAIAPSSPDRDPSTPPDQPIPSINRSTPNTDRSTYTTTRLATTHQIQTPEQQQEQSTSHSNNQNMHTHAS